MRAALCSLFALSTTIGFAAEEKVPAAAIPLDGVQWAGPPLSPSALAGKTTIVLVYASWCPKCNVWSGDLFKGLRDGIKDKPVVLLAIYADENPGEAQKYVTDRAFAAPNIIHGFDPKMPQKLGFDSNLFHYVTYGPTGEVLSRGSAGAYYGDADNKVYAPVQELNRLGDKVGSFRVLTPGLSPNVQSVLWPLELGLANDATITKARNGLNADEKAELDGVVETFMETGLKEVKANYKGEVQQQFTAYEKASQLAGIFKGSAGNKTARDVMQFMEKDEKFKKEWGAKKAYEAAATKAPALRRNLMKTVATRFPGTYYGKLAEDPTAK